MRFFIGGIEGKWMLLQGMEIKNIFCLTKKEISKERNLLPVAIFLP